MNRFLSGHDLARMADITPPSVYMAVHRGELKPAARTKSGGFLFTEEQAQKFVEARRIKNAERGA